MALGASKSGIAFGTDGWRGILGQDMIPDTVAVVAQAFAEYLHQKRATPMVAVGFDGRAFSRGFASLFSRVLASNGCAVTLTSEVVPTPVLSYAVHARSLDAGVMITASHNPPQYNGIKFKASYGGPFVTEETHAVERLIGVHPVRYDSAEPRPVSILDGYRQQVERLIDFHLIRNAKLPVLVDSMHGAGAMLLESLLREHGCPVRTVAGDPRNDFGGRTPEPIERNLKPLVEAVSADPEVALGVATDGDADRVGVVLDGGRWLNAQETILLLVHHVVNVRKAPGGIVKTCSVTDKVRELLGGSGRDVHEVQVGFKYVCEKMTSRRIAIGCEESGGYGYGEHIPERDGILSALMLIEMLAASGFRKLSEMIVAQRMKWGEIHYDRIDLEYGAEDRLEILPQLQASPPRKLGPHRVRHVHSYASSRGIVNGLKFVLDGSCRWLLLRASETEPLVRMYAEGRSDDEVRGFLTAGRNLVSARSQ